MCGLSDLASRTWWCKEIASLVGVKAWCRLHTTTSIIHDAIESSKSEGDDSGFDLLPIRFVWVECNGFSRNCKIARLAAKLDLASVLGDDEICITYLEHNRKDVQDGWKGPAARMPIVPVTAKIYIEGCLRNLPTVLMCCRRPRSIQAKSEDNLGPGTLALLKHAVHLRRHELRSATEGSEGLSVPSEIIRILADTNIKHMDFGVCQHPVGLGDFFNRPRKSSVMRIYQMPEDKQEWARFGRNVVGLTRFKIPWGATSQDLDFILDHNIVELCGGYCDRMVDFLEKAPLPWKSRVRRLGLRWEHVEQFVNNVLPEMSSLEHIIVNTWNDDYETYNANLIPGALYSLCKSRQIRVTDESVGSLDMHWSKTYPSNSTLATDIVDDFECFRHPSIDHDDVRALCVAENANVANSLRAMGVSNITSACSGIDELLGHSCLSFDFVHIDSHSMSTEMITKAIERHIRRHAVVFVSIFCRNQGPNRFSNLRDRMRLMVESMGWRVEEAFNDQREQHDLKVLEWILRDGTSED